MNQIAKILLEAKAVHIEPKEEDFYTWTSGKRSPIYCDNRQLISYPELRKEITKQFCDYIKSNNPETELIAGTATAGIPWAAWIADELSLPMIYIRSKPKGHGLKSAIEGHCHAGQKTLIIEDLISTGKSSIEAFHHAVNDKLNVSVILSIFTYGFKESHEKFKAENVKYKSLCTVEDLLTFAKGQSLLNKKECDLVLKWKDHF
jgi:orotate phosphoribosyltransferase